MQLDQKTITIVQKSLPLLIEHGLTVTEKMYEILFSRYPETQAMFANIDSQSKKLATTLAAYAANIDKLDYIRTSIELIVKRHTHAHVEAKHYPMVADALLSAMREVLDPKITTDEFMAAWTNAYNYLADVLIDLEQKHYDKKQKKHS